MYRSRGVGVAPGKVDPSLTKKKMKIRKQEVNTTDKTTTVTIHYNEVKNKKQDQEDRVEREEEEKPSITHRRWKGETWNAETNEWELKPDVKSDFHAWYNEFILSTYYHFSPLGKIHKQWCFELETDNFLLMKKPRDHFKTSLISVGYSVYNLCEENLFPVLIVSKADLNTQDTFAAIKDHLENNPKILSFYGYIIDEDRKSTQELFFTQYQTVGTRDPALYCGTFGSKKVMGTHPRLAILDDIEEEELSPALMRQAKRMLDKSLIAGLPKNAKLILIGTIKGWDHTNDIYLYAEQKGIFSVYSDPASYKIDPITKKPVVNEQGDRIYGLPDMKYVKWKKIWVPVLDENGVPEVRSDGKPKMIKDFQVEVLEDKDQEWMPIYPERYTIKDLIKKRIATREVDKKTDDTFWSEFYLIPRKPGGNFFKLEKIGHFPPPPHANFQAFLEWMHEFHDVLKPVVWIDPGGKKGHGIAMCLLLFYTKYCFVIDLAVIRNGVFGAAKQLYEWVLTYGVKQIGCEANFEQEETFAEPIDRELHLLAEKKGKTINVHVKPIKNKSEKIFRIQTNIDIVVGPEEAAITLYVNQEALDFQQFMLEMSMFPKLEPGTEFEWDLMDCVSSCQIHFHSQYMKCEGIESY